MPPSRSSTLLIVPRDLPSDVWSSVLGQFGMGEFFFPEVLWVRRPLNAVWGLGPSHWRLRRRLHAGQDDLSTIALVIPCQPPVLPATAAPILQAAARARAHGYHRRTAQTAAEQLRTMLFGRSPAPTIVPLLLLPNGTVERVPPSRSGRRACRPQTVRSAHAG